MDKIKKVSDMLKLTKPKKPLKVTITGAAGNIGYALSFMVAQGYMLGNDQPLILCLLEIPPMADVLKGVAMELQDSAFPLVEQIISTTDDKIGFENCDIALLVGAKPRTKGMDRADLLQANAKIFKNQAKVLDQYASKDCKICVVGNPANTNARILAEYSQNIKKENITCLTRLDQNRSIGQISEKMQVPVKNVRNVVIWGNHSKTQFPDLQICEALKDGQTIKVSDEVTDSWTNDFIKRVQNRGAEIISVRQKSSAASAANAVCDHMRSWILGTSQGEVVSMGVWSNGNPYGIQDDLIFSFPVTCSNGEWKFYEGLNIKLEGYLTKIQKTQDELVNERNTALEYLKSNQQKIVQYLFMFSIKFIFIFCCFFQI